MSPETLPTLDELKRMDDLSAATLYRAEVQRIPLLAREEQPTYIEAAQAGDEAATHALIMNCLNWTMWRARVIHRDREPLHTDVMDLVGSANVRMLEALPKALVADDPTAYLMSVACNEMRWHVTYRDPLVARQRDQPLTKAHPGTVRLEDCGIPETGRPPDTADNQFVYDALATLSRRQQIVLTCTYGLNGEARRSSEDVAAMLNVSKETVEKYLWRAKKRLAMKLGPYVTQLGLRDNGS